jgi:hypothetical protein
MATKKQQKRKYQRARAHARLYDGAEAGDAADAKEASKSKSTPKPQPRVRGMRQPTRPTWTRSARRAALFAVGLFLFVSIAPFSNTKPTVAQAAFQAVSFFVFLVPFGYLMDGFIYNRWLKRQG